MKKEIIIIFLMIANVWRNCFFTAVLSLNFVLTVASLATPL